MATSMPCRSCTCAQLPAVLPWHGCCLGHQHWTELPQSSGMLGSCVDQAEHMHVCIQLLLQADDPGREMIWAPLVVAGGDAAQLQPELQPYDLHMKAALASRFAITCRGLLAAKAMLLELLDAVPEQQPHVQEQDNSTPPTKQQLLQRLLLQLQHTLMITKHEATNLGTVDLAELLCRPANLNSNDRQTSLISALLQAAYDGEGA
ncbi:hypothetical protein COO60DRAFT_515852 [Scenedesmus sp. NREL 46B-D3]|nr:hypothetical protein COO60DRAFT_515852 [Scenedesmus sp. NREL 46B-D3]